MEKQSGPETAAADRYPIGWPELSKIMLASTLGAFALRGGLGLSRLIGRRLTQPPIDEEEEEARPEMQRQLMSRPGPAPKYAHEKEAKTGMHPAVASALALGMGGGGAYLGWRAADWMSDKRRTQELQSEIERKKKEYEKLLLGRPQVELRTPKLAACIDRFSEAHEALAAEGNEKQAGLLDMAPYAVYLLLGSLAANEMFGAYQSAQKGSRIGRRLEAFRSRPRRRTMPVRARLSQPRQPQREILTSATRLPNPVQERMTREEKEEDPTRGR